MGTVLPQPEVPGPDPGGPGHFDHHDWLTESAHALDDALSTQLEGAKVYSVIVAISVTASSTGTQRDVTFPVGLFTAPPVVALGASGSSAYVLYTVGAPSAQKCTVNVRHINDTSFTTTVNAHVIAVGV